MAPKVGLKKAKNAVTVGMRKSPDKLRAKVAASAAQAHDTPLPNPADSMTDFELEAKNKERDCFGLPPLMRSEGVSAPPESAPVSDSTPAPAPAPAEDAGSSAAVPSIPAPTQGTTAAGSALNAKRALNGAAEQPLGPTVTPAAAEAAPPTAAAAAVVVPTSAELLDALKAARKATADKEKLLPGMVVPTEVLELVAQQLPSSLASLAGLPGFGVTRAERYGEPLLMCVCAHRAALEAAGCAVPDRGDVMADGKTSGGGVTDAAASSPAAAPSTGMVAAPSASGSHSVTIRYSHYRQSFAITAAGRLEFGQVDGEYMLSHVFEGDFSCHLMPLPTPEGAAAQPIRPEGGRLTLTAPAPAIQARPGSGSAPPMRTAHGIFAGLTPGAEYTLHVEEDPRHAAAGRQRGGDGGRVGDGGRGGGGRGGGGRSGSCLFRTHGILGCRGCLSAGIPGSSTMRSERILMRPGPCCGIIRLIWRRSIGGLSAAIRCRV